MVYINGRSGPSHYDPTIGRWTSKDPIGFAGGDTNLYAYVGGNPMSFIDPSGLTAQDVAEALSYIRNYMPTLVDSSRSVVIKETSNPFFTALTDGLTIGNTIYLNANLPQHDRVGLITHELLHAAEYRDPFGSGLFNWWKHDWIYDEHAGMANRYRNGSSSQMMCKGK